jgi:hypothetical protein
MITYRMILLFTHTKFNNPGTKLGVGTDVVHWDSTRRSKILFLQYAHQFKAPKMHLISNIFCHLKPRSSWIEMVQN